MNLKSIAFTFCFSLLSLVTFSQIKYSYTQKLGSIASVGLPDTPKIGDVRGFKQYVVNYHGVIFQAAFGHVNKGLKNSLSASGLDSLYSDYMNGFLRSSNSNLIYKDNITINGHRGVQFTFKGELKKQNIYGYYRLVALNDTLLTCGIISSDLAPRDDKNITGFFNNFKVISVAELDEIDATNTAQKLGKGIAWLIAVGLLGSIGFGIVFLLKKLIYKKQKDQIS